MNTTTNQWRALARLPQPRSHISGATFVMDGRIIVVGGKISFNRAIRDVVAYNPLSNRWTALTSLPEAGYSGVARDIENQIFYGTGAPGFSRTTFKGVPVP